MKPFNLIIVLIFISLSCRNKVNTISGFWREINNSSSYEFLKNGKLSQRIVYKESEDLEPVIINRECDYSIRGDSIFIHFPKIVLPFKLSYNMGRFIDRSEFKGVFSYLMKDSLELKGTLNMNKQLLEVKYKWVVGDIEINQYKSLREKEKLVNSVPSIITYQGDARDEMGNTAHYILKIKSDFSFASIAGGPYSRLERLSNNLYQWVDGSIIGIKIRVNENSCTLYNFDGSYFCTLYK